MTDKQGRYIIVELERLEEAIGIARDGDTLAVHIDAEEPGLYVVHDHSDARELRHVPGTRPVLLKAN